MNELDPFGIIGRTLDGQYRVEAFVGEGSFSAVYRGMQDGLGEACAVKCLKLPGGLEPDLIETFVRRFRDESKLHYRLAQGNLNIARSLAAGSFAVEATGQVVPYIVFEWLEGRTLAQEIEVRREVGDGPMVIEDAVRVLRTAADALTFAHSQGVVHRDVTPGNLFLLRAAHPPRTKVLDFGLAKVVSDHAMDLGPRAPTMGYLKLFSPAYAAPEQFDHRFGAIGPWTDVYAFAQILVELQLGRPMCEGESLADYAKIAMNRDHRPSPRTFGLPVPDTLEAVFQRALTVDPAQRYANLGDFWAELTRAVEADDGQPLSRKPQFAEEDEMTHVSSVDEMRGIMDGLRSVGVEPAKQVITPFAQPGEHPPAGARQALNAAVAARSIARMPAASGPLGGRVVGAKPPPPRPSQAAGKLRTSSPAFARTSVDPQLQRARDTGASAAPDKFARTSKAFPAPQGTLPATPPWQVVQSPADGTPPAPSTRQPSFVEDDDEHTVIRAPDEDSEVVDRSKSAPRPRVGFASPFAGSMVDPHATTAQPFPPEDARSGSLGQSGRHKFGATFAMADPMRNQMRPEPLPAPASVPQPWQGHGGPQPQQPPIPAASGPMASMMGVHHPAPDHGSGSFPFAAAGGQPQQPFVQQPFVQQPFAHQGQQQQGGPFALPLSGLPEQRGPGGGAIAANYSAPGAPTPPVADMYAVPVATGNKRGLYIGLGIVGIVLLTAASFGLTRALHARSAGGVTPTASASAAPPPVVAPPPPEPPPAIAPPEPPPAIAPPEPTKSDEKKPVVKPEPVKPEPVKPQPVKPAGNKFNMASANGALAAKNAQIAGVCARRTGPAGSGRALVTFGHDGKVTSVAPQGAFAGTDQGACVQSFYKTAFVGPFEGTGSATGNFNIPKQ